MKQNQVDQEILMSGDDAIGRGAIEAGISLATSYPGTPATEILEYIARNFTGPVEWAVNEKVALETAIGTSYAGKRAICSMKHVGLNVASDPLMTVAYLEHILHRMNRIRAFMRNLQKFPALNRAIHRKPRI